MWKSYLFSYLLSTHLWLISKSQHCSPLEPPFYGSLLQPCGTEIGSICSCKCNDPSFESIGSCTRTCQPTGQWSGSPLVCLNRSVQCNPFPLGLNIALNGSTCFNYAGSVCSFVCDSMFSLNGPDRIFCSMSGTWSSLPPQCLPKGCPPIQGLANGVVSGVCGALEVEGGIQSGSQCIVSCNPGFVLVGQRRLVCQNSRWSTTLPSCVKVPCDSNQIAGLIVTDRFCSQPQLNQYCTGQCPPNTIPEGDPVFLCTENGWSTNFKRCRTIRCPPLQPPINGFMSGKCQDAIASDICMISCSPGFVLSGFSKLTCTNYSNWDRDIPTCLNRQCPPFRIPQFGTGSNCIQALPGTRCQIFCNSGYQLIGQSSFACQFDGTWDSNSSPVCQPQRCQDWVVPIGGVFVNECSDNTECYRICPGNPNQQCILRCGQGYRLVGPPQPVNCSPTSLRWSIDPLPTCESIK